MLTVNMPDHGLANGSRGIIIDFEDEESNIPNPVVRFMDGKVLTIKPYDFTIDEQGDVIKKIQIPLMHSWAITIHKAQGMSLDFVKTDIGSSIFEYGQAYVVLSRIKNIEGLSLLNIDYSKIIAHPKIVKYYEKLKN
jgi:ATP-dependent DNA helicase PIF1